MFQGFSWDRGFKEYGTYIRYIRQRYTARPALSWGYNKEKWAKAQERGHQPPPLALGTTGSGPERIVFCVVCRQTTYALH